MNAIVRDRKGKKKNATVGTDAKAAEVEPNASSGRSVGRTNGRKYRTVNP